MLIIISSKFYFDSSHSSHRNTSTSTTSTNNATMLDECNQLSMAGFFEEESAAINHDSIANNAMLDFAKFSRSAQNFRKLVKAILEAKNTKGASLEGVDKPFIDYKIQGKHNFCLFTSHLHCCWQDFWNLPR